MWVVLYTPKGANTPLRLLGERSYKEEAEAIAEAEKQAPLYLQTLFFTAKVQEKISATINVERKVVV